MATSSRSSRLLLVLGLISLLALSARPAGAQQGRPAAPGSVRGQASRVEPWTPVRLWLTDGRRVSGRLRAVGEGGLLLEGRPEPVPLGSVDSLRVRGRSTRTGFLVGLIGGGAAGTALGALIGAVVEAVCEYDCGSTGEGILAGAGLGLLAGGAGGAGLGAVLGSAIPRWVPPGRGAGASIGVVRAGGDWSRLGTDADDSGVGGDVSMLAAFGPLEVGPEAGWHGLGTNPRTLPEPCPLPAGSGTDTTGICLGTRPVRESAWHVGGVARLAPFGGSLRPYAVGGMGFYQWRSGEPGGLVGTLDLLGYSLGAGARWSPGPVGWGLHAEVRWHSNLSRTGGSAPRGFVTAGAGASLRW